MRFSRHCYDKPHRCPGWAGGGTRYPKDEDDRCINGRIRIDYNNRWYRWQFHRCSTCDVVCWPIHIQKLDPTWWRWMVWWRFKSNVSYAWRNRQHRIVLMFFKLHLNRVAWHCDQRWQTNLLYMPEAEEAKQ